MTALANPSVAPPLSLSDGGAVPLPTDHPRSLADALKSAATRQPQNGIGYLDATGQMEFQSYPSYQPVKTTAFQRAMNAYKPFS